MSPACTGAFLLAEAGLLAGRRATTHWAYSEELARCYPDVRVDAEPIHVRDGNVVTSAGVTAGIDLALALVEEDIGRAAALSAAAACRGTRRAGTRRWRGPPARRRGPRPRSGRPRSGQGRSGG